MRTIGKMKAVLMGVMLCTASLAHADIQSRFMNQPVYSASTATVLKLGSSPASKKAFFEQDFRKMTLEQKEFVGINLVREFAFFNIEPGLDLSTLPPLEKEMLVNREVTNPVHQRIRVATLKVIKDIMETTDFNSDKNPQSLDNLKKYLVKLDLLMADDKIFDFINDFRFHRFDEQFDSNDINYIWKEVFEEKYGKEIPIQSYIMFDGFEARYPQAEINKMFEKVKEKQW